MMDNEQMQKFIRIDDRKLAKKATNEERSTRRQKFELLKDDEKYSSYVSNEVA